MRRFLVALTLFAVGGCGTDLELIEPEVVPDPLRVRSTRPYDGSSHVQLDAEIYIEFRDDFGERPIPAEAFTINGKPMEIAETGYRRVVLAPVEPLEVNRHYTVIADADAWPREEGGLYHSWTWRFTTHPGRVGETWSVETAPTSTDLTTATVTHGSWRGLLVGGPDGSLYRSRDGIEWGHRYGAIEEVDYANVLGHTHTWAITTRGDVYFSFADGGGFARWDSWLVPLDPEFKPQLLRFGSSFRHDYPTILAGSSRAAPSVGRLVGFDGESFVEHDLPGVTINDVYSTWDTYELFAVGSRGTLVRSVDGVEWIQASLPFGLRQVQLNAMWHRAGANGEDYAAVVVGEVILFSSDGTSWQQVGSPTTQMLNDVHFTGEHFIAVGDGGAVIESEDGINWTLVDVPTSADLHSITGGYIDRHLAVVVGDGGTILRTPSSQPN